MKFNFQISLAMASMCVMCRNKLYLVTKNYFEEDEASLKLLHKHKVLPMCPATHRHDITRAHTHLSGTPTHASHSTDISNLCIGKL